jgi:hypothetical protein
MSTMNESYQREKLNLQEVFPWTSVLIVLVPSAFELNEMRCTSERDATYKSSLRGSLCSFSSTADGPSSVNMACQRERLRLVILNFEDLFTRVFFGRTKNSAAFHHDLDMDSYMFENGGLVYWSFAP